MVQGQPNGERLPEDACLIDLNAPNGGDLT